MLMQRAYKDSTGTAVSFIAAGFGACQVPVIPDKIQQWHSRRQRRMNVFIIEYQVKQGLVWVYLKIIKNGQSYSGIYME